MKNRIIRLLTMFAFPVFLVVLGTTLLSAEASAKTAAPPARLEAQKLGNQAIPTIFALRRISIPFGIEVPVHLDSAGSAVVIEGHAECPEGSTAFHVRTTVTQAATGAKAKSQFATLACDASPATAWDTVAHVQGPVKLIAGEVADVCVMALFDSPKQGTVVFQWCYNHVAVSQAD